MENILNDNTTWGAEASKIETNYSEIRQGLGNLFLLPGFIRKTDGKQQFEQADYLCTDFLPVADEAVMVKGYEHTNISIVTYYDVDKVFISSYGSTNGEKTISLTAAERPENCRYIRCSTRKIQVNPFVWGVKNSKLLDEQKFSENNKLNKIPFVENVAVAYKDLSINLSNTSGFSRNLVARTNANYRSTSTSLAPAITEGYSYAYNGEIDNEDYCGVVYLDASKNWIGYEAGGIGVYRNFILTPPDGAAFIIISTLESSSEKSLVRVVEKSALFKHDRFIDATETEGISAVSNFLKNNKSGTLIGDYKRVLGECAVLDEVNVGSYKLRGYDKIRNQYYFANGFSLYKSTDFVQFDLVHTFSGSVGGVRLCVDGSLLVTIGNVEAETFLGGLFKSDASLENFTQTLTNAGYNGGIVEGWGFHKIGSYVACSDYDSNTTGTRSQANLYLSVNEGDSFTKILDFYTTDFYSDLVTETPSEDGKAHIHGCAYDPYENRAWAVIGDSLHKWILYSDPITDINSVTWNGISLLDTHVGETQMINVFPMKDCLIFGSDSLYNGIYVVHRGSFAFERVHTITPENQAAITFIPFRIIKEDSGIVYINCIWQGGDYKRNTVIATSDGINYTQIWESESDLSSVVTQSNQIFEVGNNLMVYDISFSKIYTLSKPVLI